MILPVKKFPDQLTILRIYVLNLHFIPAYFHNLALMYFTNVYQFNSLTFFINWTSMLVKYVGLQTILSLHCSIRLLIEIT